VRRTETGCGAPTVGAVEGKDLEANLNLLGAIVAVVIFVSAILVFVSRLAGKEQYQRWLFAVELLMVVPLGYLLFEAPQLGRPALYYLQVSLMIGWLLVELLLDYVLKVEFRQNRRAVIAYVMFFFAAAGGMLGVASLAGRTWMLVASALFLLMAALAFVQRAVTGR
jgi:hypothetical protein